MCHCTEYKLSAFQVRLSKKNKLNATTQLFITAKISGCALKQGSETHSSLRQSNLQLQNQAALRSRQIRAVEHWKCAAGPAGAHPGLQDRILLNYTRIENAHKKTFVFCDYKSPQACNQGGEASPRKIFVSPGKMCWTYFETIRRSLKKLSPSPKSFRPPRCPKLVTGIEVQQTISKRVLFFPCCHIIKCLNASLLTTAAFELV